jgi:hypothetical protein
MRGRPVGNVRRRRTAIDGAYTLSVCFERERSPYPPWPARTRAEPRLRPQRDYDTYFGRGKTLPFGQVYATLARLARDGKVMPGEVEPGAGPDRKRSRIR